jgi:hypothetical protein
MWHGVKPDVGHLRPFGAKAYVHIPNVRRTKLDPKSKPMIFVGYAEYQKAYRFYNPQTASSVVVSRDAVFIDPNTILTTKGETANGPNVFPVEASQPEVASNLHNDVEAEVESEDDRFSDAVDDDQVQLEEEPADIVTATGDLEVGGSPTEVKHNSEIRRSTRKSLGLKPKHLSDYVAIVSDDAEPKSYAEAIKSKEATEWRRAMDEEYRSLVENRTWTLVPRPPNRNVVGCKWVFKRKVGMDLCANPRATRTRVSPITCAS